MTVELDQQVESQAWAALDVPTTPAYVYSTAVLRENANHASVIASQAGCNLLYTLKPSVLVPVLEALAPCVEGFAASAAFEARIAASVATRGQSIHCYSPAYSGAEMAEVLSLADYVTLNSYAQVASALQMNDGRASLGLRVNPEVSFASDVRIDPCRPGSKLGVQVSALSSASPLPAAACAVDGIHVHNNCESDDLGQLAETVFSLNDVLMRLEWLTWINLGGGYYLGSETDAGPLVEAVNWLSSEFGLKVFVEPGTTLVQNAGFLVTEVLDVFRHDGVDIAVLDTSTSHLPEVFEYGYRPAVVGPQAGSRHPVTLAGRSCLAGDVVGEYRFGAPVSTGERLAILDSGAYTHSRAAPFNGIPVPDAYMMDDESRFQLVSRYEYREFLDRNGAMTVAAT